MRRSSMALAGMMAITLGGGCRSGHLWPFQPQGTLHQQQSEAIVHDPFPMPDIAPSDNSERPREFRQPLPEPVRNRIVPQSQIWTAP